MNKLSCKSFKALLLLCFFLCLQAGTACSAGANRALIIQDNALPDTRTTRTLIEQPDLQGIEGNFFVPPATKHPPPIGHFSALLWQPNPFTPDGMLVPTAWSAGDKTGFYPSKPVEKHQSAFRDLTGSSTVQIEDGTIGAYINAEDVLDGTHESKMMITPQYRIPPEQQVNPFGSTGARLVTSLDLQVPTAVDLHRPGSNTYVVADLLFRDRKSRTLVSYGVALFFNGHPDSKSHIGYDKASRSYMVNSPLSVKGNWVTMVPGSAIMQGSPWAGWKSFEFSISEDNFRNALAALREKYRDLKISTDLADYLFISFHLNAELKFGSGPAELGWSMKSLKIYLEGDGLKEVF